VTTSQGKSRLVNNVSDQVNKRLTDLPQNTNQTVKIDVRGQHVANDTLQEIKNNIVSKTNGNISTGLLIYLLEGETQLCNIEI
jgi:hypothetical protein